MHVLHCEFPDDAFYDVENDVWLKEIPNGNATLGITSVLSFLAGHIQKLDLKTENFQVHAGQSIGTIETAKYFGAIRSPISAKIAKFNLEVQRDPGLVNSKPYEEGWIAELAEFDQRALASLAKGSEASRKLEARIAELKVKCFKKLPDKELFSVGSECLTTLANLNEMLEKSQRGTTVHIVTDDPFAEIEMTRWADQTGNELLETREEDKLVHFLIEKN